MVYESNLHQFGKHPQKSDKKFLISLFLAADKCGKRCPADCADERRKGVPQIAQMNAERKLSEDPRETNSFSKKTQRRSARSAGNKFLQKENSAKISEISGKQTPSVKKLSEDQRDQRETNSFRKKLSEDSRDQRF